jgi:hypothetical protein
MATTGGATADTTGTTGGSTTGSATTSGRLTTSTSGTTTGTGTGTGPTTTSGTGTTGPATTTGGGTTGGTTSPALGPFVPYDGGPRVEPAINYDAGCSALLPLYVPLYGCAQCTKNADCPSPLVCNTNRNSQAYHCVQCAQASDCDAGYTCNLYINPYYLGNDECQLDCRVTAGVCNPGFCETDAGVCYPGYCATGSDCVVDGGGVCDVDTQPFPGLGMCVPCTMDAGGCVAGSFCLAPGPFANAGVCAVDCSLDAGLCSPGRHCVADGGPVSLPDGGSVVVGACEPGCWNLSDCSGLQLDTTCAEGQCVECAVQQDCPDWHPGCTNNTCDTCGVTSDCPGTLHCDTSSTECGNGRCDCYSSGDCPLDVPTCLGATDSGTISGRCACATTSECPVGYVCENRFPYTVTNGCATLVGGSCIKACTQSLDCQAIDVGIGNTSCNTVTGYCECSGEYAWLSPGVTGTCEPACSYQNGVDSCFSQWDYSTCNTGVTPYCDTYTGQCRQCVDDYDCINIGCSTNEPFCNLDGGYCEECRTGDDCPLQKPSCFFPAYNWCSTYCESSLQCPSDGGYQCFPVYDYSEVGCFIPCLPGDDAGMGTVSDAGPPCPTNMPFCVSNVNGGSNVLDAGIGICSQCLGSSDTLNCDAGFCPSGDCGEQCSVPFCTISCC